MKKLLTTTALTLTLAIPPMGMAIAESHDSATKVEKSGSATILKNEETGTTVKMSTDGNSAEVTIIDEKAKGDESTKAVETEIEKTDDTMQQAEQKKPEDDMVKSEETVVMEKDEKLENSDDTMNQVEIEKTEKEMVKDGETVVSETETKLEDGERKSYSWVSRPGPATYIGEGQKGQILASDLIGMRVYAVDRDLDENEFYEESARTDWDDIGEINDLVVGWNGEIQAVILGVGGFLGLGEKDVAVEISSLKRVRERDDSDDWFLVVNSTKDQLENAPTYKR